MIIMDYLKIAKAFFKAKRSVEREIKNMENGKKWYQSKTVWFNALTGLITVATALQNSALAADPKVQAGVGLFITIGNVVLRFMTGQPIVVKDASVPKP